MGCTATFYILRTASLASNAGLAPNAVVNVAHLLDAHAMHKKRSSCSDCKRRALDAYAVH